MPALAPYIPAKDAAFDAWANNFSALATATPATYGLSAGIAATIAVAYALWAAAYALVTSPSTKTKTTVSEKNTQRVNLLAIMRPISQQVANNAGVASSDKTAIGVNPRTSTPNPITAPTSLPILAFASANPLQTHLRYSDSVAGPAVKSKPYGVVAVQFYGQTSATAITDPTLLPLKATITKSPLTLAWGSGDVGKTAYVAARYITRKGLVGPWSAIMTFAVI
jgi:hypothetical protein